MSCWPNLLNYTQTGNQGVNTQDITVCTCYYAHIRIQAFQASKQNTLNIHNNSSRKCRCSPDVLKLQNGKIRDVDDVFTLLSTGYLIDERSFQFPPSTESFGMLPVISMFDESLPR